MKFARLVFANLTRNKLRTALTVISVIVAFFLFGALRTVITTLDAVADVGSEARLVTSHASGITFVLPQSYTQRLQAFQDLETPMVVTVVARQPEDQRVAEVVADDQLVDGFGCQLPK